jgi:hypothetical protein
MMMMVVIVGIIAWPIGIPITATITYTPPNGIPSAIVIRTIPRIPVPRIPIPRIIHKGNTVPIPGIVEMASVETCQTKTIEEVHVVAIGEAFLVSITISQVVQTLGR